MTRYELLRKRIRGPVMPIVAPFQDDGKIDFKSLRKYIGFLVDSGHWPAKSSIEKIESQHAKNV